MEGLWLILLLMAVVAVVSLGALSETALAAAYARIWARLSERRAKG